MCWHHDVFPSGNSSSKLLGPFFPWAVEAWGEELGSDETRVRKTRGRQSSWKKWRKQRDMMNPLFEQPNRGRALFHGLMERLGVGQKIGTQLQRMQGNTGAAPQTNPGKIQVCNILKRSGMEGCPWRQMLTLDPSRTPC